MMTLLHQTMWKRGSGVRERRMLPWVIRPSMVRQLLLPSSKADPGNLMTLAVRTFLKVTVTSQYVEVRDG
jgi:hypothetical protein